MSGHQSNRGLKARPINFKGQPRYHPTCLPIRKPYDETVQTPREAKELLIATITQQAQREGTPLSEIETKMLYYSEVDWMPYDPAEVNADFEAQYDTGEYETKISSLIRSFCVWAKEHAPELLASWKSAAKALHKEDHYILVLIGIADGSLSTFPAQSSAASTRSLFHFVVIGLAIGAVIILVAVVVLELIAHLRN